MADDDNLLETIDQRFERSARGWPRGGPARDEAAREGIARADGKALTGKRLARGEFTRAAKPKQGLSLLQAALDRRIGPDAFDRAPARAAPLDIIDDVDLETSP